MISVKKTGIIIALFIALAVITMAVAAAADVTSSNSSQARQFHTQVPEAPPQVTSPPVQAAHSPSGEVEVPMRPNVPRPFPRPTESETHTIPPTTISATQTVPQTTVSTTQTVPQTTVSATQTVSPTASPTVQSTVPVVTVTVLVYPSGNVYQPGYYYPRGYPYNGNYYPPYYPYDVNSYYARGSLTVTSYPSDAVVTIDGYNTETTPFVFGGLTQGYHTVEINYPGYEAYVTNVYIDSGSSMEVDANLVPLVNYGSLFVDSTPRGADVYMDGNYEGTSPLTISAVTDGDHQLELHLAGYEVLTTRQHVTGGQGTTVNLFMVPYSSSSYTGSINVISNLPGAVVYLDGIYKGSSQAGTIFNIIAVSPGSHTVLLHLPGYADVTQTVQVTTGQIANVNAVFTPSSAVPQGPQGASATGSIVVTSSPSGGQVFVDNQFRGVAPVTIYNMAAGNHIVNLKLTGFSDFSTSVDVPAGQVVQVPATFAPGQAPTHAALSPIVMIGALAIGFIAMSGRGRK